MAAQFVAGHASHFIDTQQMAQFHRQIDPVGVDFVVPVAEPGDTLSPRQLFFVFQHPQFDLPNPQRVTNPLSQQCPVDRLGDEVGRAGVKRDLHRHHIVEAGQHQDRHMAGRDLLTDRSTGVVTIHHRHPHVHEHRVGVLASANLHALQSVGRLQYRIAGVFQHSPDHHAGHVLVIDDQNPFVMNFFIVRHA